MSVFLLAYSATAYVFSGSVCYIAAQAEANQHSEHSTKERLASLWIALLWPLWIAIAVGKEEKVKPVHPERELVGSGRK